MDANGKRMINPASLAFDIDGVFADTMTLFLDIAREDFKIYDVSYEDITCYILEECLDMDPDLIETILIRCYSCLNPVGSNTSSDIIRYRQTV